MASEPKRLKLHVILGSLGASVLAFYLGTGLHPLWWLTWLAPLPLLLLSPRLSWRLAFAISLLASLGGSFNLWHYLHHILGIPLLPATAILFIPAAIFAPAVLLFRWCILRGAPLQAAVAFPSFWVCAEFLNASASIHSTAGNLAYSQMNFLPILQIASVTGIWGISFCLFLFSASLAAIRVTPGRPREKWALAFVCGVLLATVLAFGFWRLHSSKRASMVTVALIASDLPENELPSDQEGALRLFREYAAQIDALAPRQVQTVVIPEKVAVALPAYIDQVDSLFSASAARSGAVVVVGMVRRDSNGLWNEARIYFPDGSHPRTYEKHHMLPPFESEFIIGTSLTILSEPSGLWGVAICKDMDFPRLSREYGLQGSGLLLVPAWDFDADGWWHGRMAILRGIEDGFSIARTPRHGILTVTDDRGRVLAECATNSRPFTVLLAQVPVQHESTLYSRWGNWFPWFALGLLVVCVASTAKLRA